MKMKKAKRMLGSICAATVLLSSIPSSGMVASANETPMANGVEFYDASGAKLEDAEYSLHGVEYVHDDITNQGLFVRLPEEETIKISKEKTFTGDKEPSLFDKNGEWVNTVYSLARESAGGRIRFNTDSTTIKIEAQLYLHDFAHYDHGDSMKAAQLGFDVYVDTAEGSTYAGTVQGTPDVVKNADDEVTGIASNVVNVNGTITFDTAESRDITIYFPIVIETNSVKISVDDGSTVGEHVNDYEGEGRIVFYGSSITQGGAVTKPGNTYVNTVGRNLNREYIDFGMWGRCKGEETFANYIGSLGDVSAFVLDYDHNNSNVEGLSNHYRFYELVRAEYPDIPIIMMTRPGSGIDNSKAQYPDEDYSWASEMKAVIRQSYETAKAAGDENVHFIDGETFFGYSKAYMADNSHPNDAGQARMAEVVTATFKQIYAGEKNLCVVPSTCDEELVMSEDFSGAEVGTEKPNGWKTSIGGITTGTMGVNEDGAYEFAFLRDSGSSIMTLYPNTTYWSDGSDSAVEMDVNLYKTDNNGTAVYPQLGVKIGETPCSSNSQKYEIRIRPVADRYTVYLYDGTNEKNPSEPLKAANLYDQSFVEMYNSGLVSFKLRIETEYVANGSVNISVLVNGRQVFGSNLVPQQAGFEPNHFRIFCYGTVSGANHKASVDNIKAYSLPEHTLDYVAEVPATTTDTGVKAHYECSECGNKFLDNEGIVSVSNSDLIIAEGCIKMLFSDDFENGDSKWIESSSKYSGDETFGIIDDNGNSVYQMLVTRNPGNTSNNIQISDAILAEYSDYTVEMDGVLYKADNGRWPAASVRTRVGTSNASGYEIQLVPNPSVGSWTIYARDRSSGGNIATTKTLEDASLSASATSGEINYHLRIVQDTYVDDNGTTKVKFLVYLGGNDAVKFDIEPDNQECTPTRLAIYLHTGTLVDGVAEDFKGILDNVKVYTDSHTIKKVDAAPSTDTVAGHKAHYACSVCDKKFADSTGKTEVTEAQLAYAKLTDIICQTKANATNSQNEDIRFLVYVDDYTKYQSVTFKITCSAGTGTAICKDVYTGVYAGGQLYTTEDIFGVDGYFATFILKNNTPTDLEDTMTVVATWKSLDGTETTKTRIVNISKERK